MSVTSTVTCPKCGVDLSIESTIEIGEARKVEGASSYVVDVKPHITPESQALIHDHCEACS